MPTLHVCPLSRLAETARETGAADLLTLVNAATAVERPPGIEAARHRTIAFNDIVAPTDGHVAPAEEHVRALLDFVRGWDRAHPLLIHCYAGISRSTAAAFVTACALDPDRNEAEVAQDLRAASPSATPNRLIVEIADRLLERDGRMIAAVAAIGRGADAFEGAPFRLRLGEEP